MGIAAAAVRTSSPILLVADGFLVLDPCLSVTILPDPMIDINDCEQFSRIDHPDYRGWE